MVTKKTTKKTSKKPTHKKPTETKKEAPKHGSKAEELENKISDLEKKYGFADKLLAQKWMKDFLGSSSMCDINKLIKPHLNVIFLIVAIYAFLATLISVLAFFGLLGLAAFGFGRGFILIMSVLVLLSALLSLLTGIGLIKKKRWLPSLILVGFGLQILSIIISLISSGSSGVMTWISMIVYGLVTLVVLKNRSYFKAK